MKKKELEKLIYKSLDSKLSEKEHETLITELMKSDEYFSEYNRLLEIRHAVSETKETDFEPFFEERLLKKLNHTVNDEKYFDLLSNSLFASFRRVAVAAIIILIILVSYNLNSGNNYSIQNLLGLSQAKIENAFDPFLNLMGTDK